MKKSSKGLILIGFATITLGASSLLGIVKPIDKNIGTQGLMAYKYNASNILDNVYKKDNNLILPLIFDNPDQKITVDTIKSEFKNAGLTVKSITKNNASTNTIGTGVKITVNENSNVYNVVIYGDVNGDGKVNLIDAQIIVKHSLGKSTVLKNGYFENIAANTYNSNDTINLIDAQRVIKFILKSPQQKKLVENEPTSIKETDSEAPKITLKGDNPVTVITGTTYSDSGATAKDAVDGDVTKNIKVDTSKVNTSKVGTYTVTYTVKDNAGNTATATRTVKVINKLSTISITPEKTSAYIYDTISATVKSGENEQAIDINNLNIKIEKIADDLTTSVINDSNTATAEKSVNNGIITVKFTAKVEGKYKITASVGNNISDSFDIEIKEDTSVTNIIPDIKTSTTFKVGIATTVGLEFKHIYSNNVEKTIDVNVKNISVEKAINAEVCFLNSNGTKISADTIQDNEDGIVKYISITPTSSEEGSVTIKVGNTTDNTTQIQIQNIEENVLSVNGIINGNSGEIDLYTQIPADQTSIKVVKYEGDIYTLLPIKLIKDGKNVKLKAKEFSPIVEDEIDDETEDDDLEVKVVEKGKLTIKEINGSSDKEQEISSIYYLPFDSNGKVVENEATAEYIGIVLTTDDTSNIKYINIYYEGITTPVKLKVNIVKNSDN